MSKDIFTGEWFPYYHERFENSDHVAAMSLTEEGAYHRAIRLAWKFGSVPSDPTILAAKIQKRCTPKIAEAVLKTFVPSESEPRRMIHPVVEAIRLEQEQKHRNHVKGGKASGKARRKRDKQDTSNNTEQCSNNGGTIPLQNQNKNQIQIQNQEDFKRLIETCARENSKIDPRLVELGVLYTLLQRNGNLEPIHSVKYFFPQIKQTVADSKTLGDKAIDALLERRRSQFWEKQEQTT